MVEICHCCGAVIPPEDLGIHLTPTEQKVFDYIRKHPRCTVNDLIEHLYNDRRDGGPLTASNNIYVYVARIRKKLSDANHDFTIPYTGTWGASFRLVSTKGSSHASP